MRRAKSSSSRRKLRASEMSRQTPQRSFNPSTTDRQTTPYGPGQHWLVRLPRRSCNGMNVSVNGLTVLHGLLGTKRHGVWEVWEALI